MPKTEIDIIPSHKIDWQQWDACIRQSSNPLIYAHSRYLDHMADNWHGIVINNYEAVMPVAWRKKYGIYYTYDVPFIQQLGCFARGADNDVNLLTESLFRFASYGDYRFNYNKIIPGAALLTNYILPLTGNYESISNVYKTDLVNNLKKASRLPLNYGEAAVDTAITVYKELYAHRLPHVSQKDFIHFEKLCLLLQQQHHIICRKITGHKNELLAVILLLTDEHRLYNLMNSTTDAGRNTAANHVLFDAVFREFAGSGYIFDFEGSDIPGVKNFYEKFGAVNQPYYSIHFNRLPFPLKFLKR